MSSNQKIFTIFNNEGKLEQVEHALKAVKNCGLSNLALKNKDGVVVVSQKLVPDTLCDQSFITNLHNITNSIGAMVIGNDGDCRSWISKIKQEAFQFKQDNGFDITTDILSQRISNVCQASTQKVGIRTFAAEVILVSFDEELGSMLYKVDAAGSYFGYKACCSGVKEQELQNIIETTLKEKDVYNMGFEELIRLAIEILQNSLGMDLKSNDLEVGIVNSNQRRFKKLDIKDLEDHLNILQKFE